MQVFLLLLDAGGKVVTRSQLFDECWGGAMVGDDSLNRAIGKVRKIAADTAPGFFEVETIPRTGYRLTGDILGSGQEEPARPPGGKLLRRRTIIAGFTAAGASGIGLFLLPDRKSPAFDVALAAGDDALAYRDPAVDPVPYFRQALAIRPGDPRAVGRLAYALSRRTDIAVLPAAASEVSNVERAVRDALTSDPRDPHAQLAEFLLQRSTLDFLATEDRLRRILAAAPANIHAMRHLWDFLVCVGRCREALSLAERAVATAPLAAGNQFPRAQLLWIVGRAAESDRVIERAASLWPSHRYVRFARFTILAFSGRARVAQGMLDSGNAPQNFSQADIELWRKSLPALYDPSPANIAIARNANREGAAANLELASQAVMVLSELGDVDSTFKVIDALYATSASSGEASRGHGTSIAWRFAPWLFVPPVASARADPRFNALCDSIGLTDYWATRGIKPDYQLAVA